MKVIVVREALRCIAVVALLAAASPAFAGVIVNGDFSDGLNGWSVIASPDTVTISGGTATVDDASFGTTDTVVSVSGVIATISQTADFSVTEIDLYQVFTVPTSPETLQFTLDGVILDQSGLNPPPGFGTSLLDPLTGLSLVPTVDLTTDSFFTYDPTLGLDAAASGVTVTGAFAPNPPLTVSLDTSSLSAGSQAEVLFRLLEGGDLSANVSISDVQFLAGPNNGGGGGPNPVPEPGTFGILLTGMTGLLWMKRKRVSVACK